MSNTKSKTLTLTKSADTEINGERRVTFVASDNSEDRDHERMNVETLRLPLKKGGELKVSAIPAEGTELIDIPLIVDHNMWEVDKTIGSVRKASYENGQLIFECGISSRPYAQDIFKLIDEQHLSNSFSISVTDYDYNFETKEISNGEIVEVSLVTRGSNKDAQVLSVKGVKEQPMNNSDTTTETPAQAEETKTETTAEEQASTEPTETAQEESQDTAVELPQEPVAKSIKPKETNMNDEIAKAMVKPEAADQTVTAVKTTASEYLKSKSALKDFTRIMIANKGKTADAGVNAWLENLSTKDITLPADGGILPTTIEQIFFKTWYDNDGILGTFDNINANAGAIYAFTGTGENIRAKGHRKGDLKVDQNVTTLRRDLKSKIIYKRLPIDLQDLIDDQTGELSRFRAEELAQRVASEIALGAILGDGRSAPEGDNPDYRVFDGTRGLWNMVADLNNSGNASSHPFEAAVARTVDNVAGDNLYDKIRKTAGQVRDEFNRGKVVIVETGDLTTLELLKDIDGRYLFQPGSDVRALLGYAIFEMDGVNAAGYDVIAYARGAYKLHSSNNMTRSWFDGNYNRDYMMVERSVNGSLGGARAVAGYVSADSE